MWAQRWKAIDRAIAGIEAAMAPYNRSVGLKGVDFHGVANAIIIPQSKSLFSAIENFSKTFGPRLPPPAQECLQAWIRETHRILATPTGIAGAGAVAASLAVLRAMMRLHLAETETVARSLVARAFEHLQRSIAADDDCAVRWQRAFENGETKCEQLGAVHLLLHGIWAFKADSKRERTDLVFNEPLDMQAVDRVTPRALVLTEWKIARRNEDVGRRFEQGREQASLYAAGSMSDLELHKTRFVVVVAEDRFAPPADYEDGGVTYRHIHIAVRPVTPSRHVKTRAGRE